MKPRLIPMLLQLAALAVLAAGATGFFWIPDSRWFWLVFSALLPPAAFLVFARLQSASADAIAGGHGRFVFRALILLVWVSGGALAWFAPASWIWWVVYWLVVPHLLGPSFVAGRWARPRVSLWIMVAVFVPVFLARWTPHFGPPWLDVAVFALRLGLAAMIMAWGMCLSIAGWSRALKPQEK